MDQKLFEQMLTEVADWHRERHQGYHKNSTSYGGPTEGPVPTYIKIDRFKSKACPYQEDKKDCVWKIYNRGYAGHPKVLIQKCDTCGALLTPKGHYIAKPNGFNYPKIIRDADQDE